MPQKNNTNRGRTTTHHATPEFADSLFDEAPLSQPESANSNTPHNGERALWRAVIAQAVLDATSGSNKSADKAEKARAIAWLAGSSPDFQTVCALADQDPHYVISKSVDAIKNTKKWKRPNYQRIQLISSKEPTPPPLTAVSKKQQQ